MDIGGKENEVDVGRDCEEGGENGEEDKDRI